MGRSEFLLAGEDLPEIEAIKAGEAYMALVVDIAREAFSDFWSSINLPEDLSLAQLEASGKSFEDLETEFGLPRGWSAGPPAEMRLYLLKQYSRSDIERLAQRYPRTLIRS